MNAAVEPLEPSATVALLQQVRRGYLPPPELRVSDFADEHIIVTSGPLTGSHWQTSFAPYQRGILDAFHEAGVEIVVVMGSSQWGKALALDTPIPTPSGWTTMGAIQPGDQVFDERGVPSLVTFVTDIQRDRMCYRVRFSDGCEIVADAEHLWYVESDTPLSNGTSWTGPGPRAGVLATEHIAGTYQRLLKSRPYAHRYAVPCARPLVLPQRNLLIHPYVLGAWLGDGKSEGGTIYSDDAGVIDELRRCGQPSHARKQKFAYGLPGLTPKLRALGVINVKHIPFEYLRASEEQRWALLAGLMDTDGHVEKASSRCEFSTTSPLLAKGFIDLVTSLGLKPKSTQISPVAVVNGTDRRPGAAAWKIRFVAYADQPLFRLPRKRDRLRRRAGRRTTETCRRRIVAVEPVPSVPVKCISVDSQSRLYLAGTGMIPTHNTACAVNIVAYHMAHDPCPIQVVEPTVDPMAKDFARNRLEPVIAATPILNDVVSKRRAKDASNTTLQKTFRGGSVTIGGANSASSLAARSTRLLVLDEIDRYPMELEGEGNTLAIALKRTTAYRNRRRIAMLSSPTLVGAPIHSWFLRGDQRRYYVPCPECDTMHPFEWVNIRWSDGDASTARLHCPACDHAIDDAERVAILARGEWRSEHPERVDKRIVSFHLWEAYSPLSSLFEIVSGFLAARDKQKTGDKSEMHTWQNTTLGEPIDPDKGTGVEPHALLLRRETINEDDQLPERVCCLTMGVDVQDDRLEMLVYGWAPGEESWLVDRQVLDGDTSQPQPWEALDAVLDAPYQHPFGPKLFIQAACIDSAGHRTTLVYDYAQRKAIRRVYAVIGRDGQRPIVSSPSRKRWGRQEREVNLYTVGVDAAKALFLSRLALTQKGPGFVHLPMADWCDDELAAQLTSERLLMKWTKGVPTQVWKKIRPRNEGLDCSVYALAALRLLNPRLGIMADALVAEAKAAALEAAKQKASTPAPITVPPAAPAPAAARPGRRFARSGYLQR